MSIRCAILRCLVMSDSECKIHPFISSLNTRLQGRGPLLGRDHSYTRTYSSKYSYLPLGESSLESSWLLTLSTLRGLVGNPKGKCLIFVPIYLHVLYTHYSRKKFMFYDNDGNLICNLVIYMIALAFADNAFKNNFTYLEEIYRLVVPPKSDCIRLRWKDS